MPYELSDDTAIADVELHAWGPDLETLFASAVDATMEVMISDPETIERRERREVTLENEAIDMLLFDLLQELVYHKDVERLLLRVETIEVREISDGYRLRATLAGERLDPERHEQGGDVKAVTLHRFCVERSEEGWRANVILDI